MVFLNKIIHKKYLILFLSLFLSYVLKAQSLVPTISCEPSAITVTTMAGTSGVFTIIADYHTPMLGGNPAITFTPTTAGNIFLSGPTYTWQTLEKLAITYQVNMASQENMTNTKVTVAGGLTALDTRTSLQADGFFDILLNQAQGVATPSPINVINGTSSFSIDVVYSTAMNTSIVPIITFSPSISGKLTLNGAASSWQADNKTYRYTYNVTNDNSQPGKITATIEDAQDASTIWAADVTCDFYIDFRKPTATTITCTPAILTATNNTMEVQVVYDEAMNKSIVPSISFSKTGVFTFATGAWDAAGTIYTATYAVTQDATGGNDGSSDITVSGAEDLRGNVQNSKTDVNKIQIKQQKPMVSSVTMTPIIINRTTTTATLTIVFDIAMETINSPTMNFSPQITSWQFVGASSGWQADNKTYKAVFNVTPIPNTTKIDNINVTVSDAVAANGNTMSAHTATNVFSIDKLGPACTNIVFTPSTLEPGATQFTIDLTYDIAMKQSGNDPQITFVYADDTPVNLSLVLGTPSASWNSPTQCRVTYPVIYNQEQILNIFAKVTGAKSTADNVQSESVSINSFSVDMKPIIVTATPSTTTVTCATAVFSVLVGFNQTMTPLPTTENIIGLPDYDYLNDGFLIFDKTEWAADNRSATVYYQVHSNRLSQKNNITIHVRPIVRNASGRQYDGGDFLNAFSVNSDPPVISNVDAVAPLCHNDANGYIHLTVTGATTPYTYSWSKDGSALSETTANLDQTQGGTYQIKVTAANSCFASLEQVLVNPDPLILQADIVQNVIRKDDGIIELSVTGGTPAYNYSMDGMPTSARVENLAIGTYQFEVIDVNACIANTEATIADYRIPTGFTPNGDGYNDTFMEGRKVKIFDRNGTLLFQGDDGWDGQYKGQTVRPAVYFYIVTFPDGSEKKGTIQVFKK